MSARSYMSIGDVLTLLRQEFPDVTISKIRFLESQGLVNPERTPSGYRKFYEHDVERLRWVLRQQREHFLPLKVIKDRLEDEPGGPEDGEPARRAESVAAGAAGGGPTPDGAGPDGLASAEADHESGPPVLVGQRSSTERVSGTSLPGIESTVNSTPTVGRPRASAAVGGTAPTGAGGATSSAATRRVVAGEPAPGPGVGEPATVPSAVAGTDMRTGSAPVDSAARRSRPSSGEEPRPAPPHRRGKPAPSPDDSGEPQPVTDGVTESPPPSRSPGAGSGGEGASLSVDELSSACGLEVGVLRELQEYGLVAASNVAGVESFGEEALAVAQLAAQFARFGIEPRHLRLYKNAADREAGFVEQIVLPLVRQRNPDARARAHETADELALLGQQLRSSLLRSALGDLLEG